MFAVQKRETLQQQQQQHWSLLFIRECLVNVLMCSLSSDVQSSWIADLKAGVVDILIFVMKYTHFFKYR